MKRGVNMFFKKRKAISAVELLITISVLGIMFTMIAGIGLLLKKTYLSQNGLSEMQQSASVALAKLSRELMETSYKTTTIYSPVNTASPRGIIFGSARNFANGNRFMVDPNTTKCRWYKYVSYYIDSDEKQGETALCRREYLVDPNGVPYTNINCGTTNAIPCPLNISTFITGGTSYTQKMIVAHRVKLLSFPDIGVSSSVIGPNVIINNLPLKIAITVAEKGDPNSAYNSVTVTFNTNLTN
jgi:hypothetical protein